MASTLKKSILSFVLLLLFWVLVFDFQRVLFTIHNLDKVSENSFWTWIQVFFQSIRLDLATGAILSIIPLLFIVAYIAFQKKFLLRIFQGILLLEVLLVSLIHAGEINAYNEWNHKLTSRVFMHLSHPDEVVRTANFSMTLWFALYAFLEVVFGYKLMRYLFKKKRFIISSVSRISKAVLFIPVLPLFFGLYFLLARGGWQQIPINIDSSYFAKSYVINDISVNSPYFFGKSFLLYKRSNIKEFLSDYSQQEIASNLHSFLNYDKKHSNYILSNTSPNLVFVILESWTAKVSHRLTGKPGATPEFDEMTKDGVLFTHLYATGSTSEIGNASIFSGYPALPEISISMQPFKHRKLKSINQSLEPRGYTAGYLFSGDLKYGNIEGYFTDHGFDRIQDESDFPSDLTRGKLNYYDEDLYALFLDKINRQKEPFIECAFTGSTHSPYDYPGHDKQAWTGKQADFMNSVIYADQSLKEFVENAKKEPWYKNTLFVFVADHGHASPYVTNPNDVQLYQIPLLLYGPALKDAARGTVVDKIGSQSDIARTLLYQMKVDVGDDYPWSKDLFNPAVPEFALQATTRGFGWITPRGNFTYHLDYQKYLINTFDPNVLDEERKRCNSFMQLLYQQWEEL